MNKFATGMLLGGAAAMAGMGLKATIENTYRQRKGSGNEASSRMGSADGIHFRRGKQECTGKIDPAATGGFAKQSADTVSRLAVGT